MKNGVRVIGLLVLVVALAGCSALDTSDDDHGREPYRVESPTPSSGDELPAGLSNDTVTSSWELLDAHRRILWNRSYVSEHVRVERYPNGTLVRESHDEITVDPDGNALARSDGYSWAWGDGEIVWTRYPGNESRGIDPVYDRGLHDKYAFTGHTEPGFTEMENITVTPIETDGSTQYVLESNESSSFSYQNATLRAVVNETGFVQSYRFERERLAEGTTLTVTTEVTVARVGDPSITVEPPEWLPDAKAFFEDRDDTTTDD